MKLCQLFLFLKLFVLLELCGPSRGSFYGHRHSHCSYDAERHVVSLGMCLDEVRQRASDPSYFWFGEKWKELCDKPKPANWIHCYNPLELQPHSSLISRLLRVRTFDAAYLKNLEIFPQVTYSSSEGTYKGCDHQFSMDEAADMFAFPDMAPASPCSLRQVPKISWPGMSGDQSFYTIAMVDVGFGFLNFLVHNYPHRPQVLRNYTGPLNFRPEATNPVALLVWQQPKGYVESLVLDDMAKFTDQQPFNVQKFILDNDFQQSLVGLNWINVGTDAYAIEQQRARNIVDNCPALLKEKLFTPTYQKPLLDFLHKQCLDTMDTWMTIAFDSRPLTFTVCCKVFTYSGETITLDPLGDKEVSPVNARNAPIFFVAPTMALYGEAYKYKRKSREFLSLLDKSLYTVLLIDVDETNPELASSGKHLVLWLVSNIPGSTLNGFTEGLAGRTELKYLMPRPSDERQHRLVFLLFQQTDGDMRPLNVEQLSSDSKVCPREWKWRCHFDIEDFMARQSLLLRSISWFFVQRDPYVTYEDIRWGQSEALACRRLAQSRRDVPSIADSDCNVPKALRATAPASASAGRRPFSHNSENKRTVYASASSSLRDRISLLRIPLLIAIATVYLVMT